jgi:pimeloyl-ACP methyl ester carboxylesterase
MTLFGKNYRAGTSLLAAIALTGCQAFHHADTYSDARSRAERAVVEAGSALRARGLKIQERDRAYARYRSAVAQLLRGIKPEALLGQERAGEGFVKSSYFSRLVVVKRPRVTNDGLHRAGLGLPIVARFTPGKTEDPNAPRSGYAIPLTVLAKESHGRISLFAVDPQRVEMTEVLGRRRPVAMNLEAALDLARETGPRPLDGLRYLLFSNWFQYPSRLVFLEPFQPAKTPVVLIHGLLSTPRMWKPVLKGLLADREIRNRYQFWFFYYPTGQPIPYSSKQLRDALTEVAANRRLRKPFILAGHSMGGVLARAQISGISPAEGERVVPGIARLPPANALRSAVLFEPRKDVARTIFIATPHRGSAMALGTLGTLAIRLIRLPQSVVSELEGLAEKLLLDGRSRFPTSIQGLSPRSRFLQALDRFSPTIPTHSIIGDSDGIVAYSSSHLAFAESELLVPAGHGVFADPRAIAEIARILKSGRPIN